MRILSRAIIFISFIALTVFLGAYTLFSPIDAYAKSITIRTDKPSYHWGYNITITGKVDGTGMLHLRILNPFQNPVSSKYFFPRWDGTFSQTILAKGPLWSVTGNYTVEVSGIPSIRLGQHSTLILTVLAHGKTLRNCRPCHLTSS